MPGSAGCHCDARCDMEQWTCQGTDGWRPGSRLERGLGVGGPLQGRLVLGTIMHMEMERGVPGRRDVYAWTTMGTDMPVFLPFALLLPLSFAARDTLTRM